MVSSALEGLFPTQTTRPSSEGPRALADENTRTSLRRHSSRCVHRSSVVTVFLLCMRLRWLSKPMLCPQGR